MDTKFSALLMVALTVAFAIGYMFAISLMKMRGVL